MRKKRKSHLHKSLWLGLPYPPPISVAPPRPRGTHPLTPAHHVKQVPPLHSIWQEAVVGKAHHGVAAGGQGSGGLGSGVAQAQQQGPAPGHLLCTVPAPCLGRGPIHAATQGLDWLPTRSSNHPPTPTPILSLTCTPGRSW